MANESIVDEFTHVEASDEFRRMSELIEILEMQQADVERDIDELESRKKNAICDPGQFCQDLVRGDLIKLPCGAGNIPSIPYIDFDRFVFRDSDENDESKNDVSNINNIENKSGDELSDDAGAKEKEYIVGSEIYEPTVTWKCVYQPMKIETIHNESNISTGLNGNNLPLPHVQIRGREYTPDKPATFNALWTKEENDELIRLLSVFPKEDVAAHRWQKIAKAMGNRTAKQVASRAQKLYQKGMAPDSDSHSPKKTNSSNSLTSPSNGRKRSSGKRTGLKNDQRQSNCKNGSNGGAFGKSPRAKSKGKLNKDDEKKEVKRRKKSKDQYYRAPSVYMSDEDGGTAASTSSIPLLSQTPQPYKSGGQFNSDSPLPSQPLQPLASHYLSIGSTNNNMTSDPDLKSLPPDLKDTPEYRELVSLLELQKHQDSLPRPQSETGNGFYLDYRTDGIESNYLIPPHT